MSVFTYTDYNKYLNDCISYMPKKGRGFKSELASYIGCQSTYVSQVLNERADFSLEQAVLVSKFLGHTEDESHFFLLLIQHKRAGSELLRQHFEKLINEQKKHRLILSKRLNVKTVLNEDDQVKYYSSWHYSAIHVILSIKDCQSKENIAKKLGLSLQKVSAILEFLCSVGLAKLVGREYQIGETHIHLEKKSPMISKHHTNWRMKSILSLDNETEDNLYYSSVITLSQEDAYKIKDLLIKNIDSTKKIIKDSPEEVLYCFSLDFFKVE